MSGMDGIFGMVIAAAKEKSPDVTVRADILIPMVFLLILYVHGLWLFGQHFLWR